MLYISRLLGHDRYEVTDTDDGTSQEINNIDLIYALHHVKITGASLVPNFGNETLKISPFQPKKMLKPQQKALLSLYGVKLYVHKDEITLIDWFKHSNAKEPPVIKLSKFGKVLGYFALGGNYRAYDEPRVILEFDDNIQLVSGALNLRGFEQDAGLLADVRKVTNPVLLRQIYSELCCEESIIRDDEERKRQMIVRHEVV